MFTVHGVKVRNPMLAVEHTDDYPEKPRDFQASLDRSGNAERPGLQIDQALSLLASGLACDDDVIVSIMASTVMRRGGHAAQASGDGTPAARLRCWTTNGYAPPG